MLYHANSATNDCPSSRDKDMIRRGHNTLERMRSLRGINKGRDLTLLAPWEEPYEAKTRPTYGSEAEPQQ